ncbi:MAG: hypothetical protein LBH19_00195 [Dysgonamonadaceae bacterium]|jgi:hypothetical protein|nr:hypothetical protein [Dysgonamonadaceae bacterium]
MINKEAEKLIKSQPKDRLILKMLHTPRGSFSGEWTDKPRQGHFIFAEINRIIPNRTYTINDDSEQTQRLLTVELDKFRVIFNLSKHIVNPWDGGNE